MDGGFSLCEVERFEELPGRLRVLTPGGTTSGLLKGIQESVCVVSASAETSLAQSDKVSRDKV